MAEYIKDGDKIIAIIIKADHYKQGIEFFTPEDFSQQLAYMNHPAGHKITPHLHNEIHRDVFYTQEVLFIKRGKVKITLYDEYQRFLKYTILKSGDVILLASGGHGFEMLEESEMIEVKQGPYTGDQDKTRFNITNEKFE